VKENLSTGCAPRKLRLVRRDRNRKLIYRRQLGLPTMLATQPEFLCIGGQSSLIKTILCFLRQLRVALALDFPVSEFPPLNQAKSSLAAFAW
jgi:hypothetical protein